MTTFPAALPEGRPNPGNEQTGGSETSFLSRSRNEGSMQVTGNGAAGPREEETHLKNKLITV